MADFQFKCPQCGRDVTADDSLAGQVARCPFCGKGVVIPRTRSAEKSFDREVVESPDGIGKGSGRAENASDEKREKSSSCKESGSSRDTGGNVDGSIVRVLSAEVTLSEQMLFEMRRTNTMLKVAIALLGAFCVTLLVAVMLIKADVSQIKADVGQIKDDVSALRSSVESVVRNKGWAEGHALKICQ